MTEQENNLINEILDKVIPEHELQSVAVKNFLHECINMIRLYAKKNHDYGNSFEVGMKRIGLPYGAGRLLDKMNRILTLMEAKAAITDESILDNITDLACYSIMTKSYIDSLNPDNNIIDIEMDNSMINRKIDTSKNHYLYIFDYSTGHIYYKNLPNNIIDTVNLENYITKVLDFKLTNISYMITDNKTDIKEIDN